MNAKLNTSAKQIANELITLSTTIDHELEKWSDNDKRPNDLDTTECVGFISKETTSEGLNLVVDLQAALNSSEAILRTWAIKSQPDSNNIERFNNIQLTFAVDYNLARQVAQKGSGVTRDDLRTILSFKDSSLLRIVVSDDSGVNNTTGETLGQRYELDANKQDQQAGSIETISVALNTVLSRLKDSTK